MRFQLLKLTKRKSSRPERIVSEIFKDNRIKFRAKVVLAGREVDFLIFDKFVLEIGDHKQNSEKNRFLVENGYKLMQMSNKEIYKNRNNLEEFLLKWLHVSKTPMDTS